MPRFLGIQRNTNSHKRKRKSLEDCSNIENEPRKPEEKKAKMSPSNDPVVNIEERVPLGELSRLRIANGNVSQADLSPLNELKGECSSSNKKEFSNEEDYFSLVYLSTPEAENSNSLIEKAAKPLCKILFWNNEFLSIKMDWADTKILWKYFCRKDLESNQSKDCFVFEKHPNLQPKMRSILLEWLVEVCDVYSMHRETYYRAMDYLDRYLNSSSGIQKTQFQLIGITCLFIASKVEEIYPPKLSEFAYVTDGACSEEDIKKMEAIIIKKLDWKMAPHTANNWLTVYLQLCYKDNGCMLFPQFPKNLFSKMSQLLDLVTLDSSSLKYSNSILAATCLYLACSSDHALRVSGYNITDIIECIDWMESYNKALIDAKKLEPAISGLPLPDRKPGFDFSYAVQKHTVTLDLLESAQQMAYKKARDSDLNLLTPPPSSKRCSIKLEHSSLNTGCVSVKEVSNRSGKNPLKAN